MERRVWSCRLFIWIPVLLAGGCIFQDSEPATTFEPDGGAERTDVVPNDADVGGADGDTAGSDAETIDTEADPVDTEPDGAGGDTVASCSDDVKNGGESGIDCGGPCGPCEAGQRCRVGADCQSNSCSDQESRCLEPTCDDEIKNGDETGVDCGGECQPCGVDDRCEDDRDCRSGVCRDSRCQEPSCQDEVENGEETDVDCGGPCPECEALRSCEMDTDCVSGHCMDGVCQEPTCSDEVENGEESDVDCGGSECTPCQTGASCNVGDDCQSGVCQDGSCASPSCTDEVENGDETGVDCGGDTCDGCAAGEACSGDEDCRSEVCSGGICQSPTCTDEVENGGESDVDCGGSMCSGCELGKNCQADSDCESGYCSSTTCTNQITGALSENDPGHWSDGSTAESCDAYRHPSGKHYEYNAAGDGYYEIAPVSSAPSFVAYCDMTTDGGGWTRITPCMARNHLDGTLYTDRQNLVTATFDSKCRPKTRDKHASNDTHTAHYTFDFPPGFEESRLVDYEAKANAGPGDKTEIDPTVFEQQRWASAHDGKVGDISFGEASASGPEASFARSLSNRVECEDCRVPWPSTDETIFTLGSAATQYRIGWGEGDNNSQSEGWYPWWKGYIYLR